MKNKIIIVSEDHDARALKSLLESAISGLADVSLEAGGRQASTRNVDPTVVLALTSGSLAVVQALLWSLFRTLRGRQLVLRSRGGTTIEVPADVPAERLRDIIEACRDFELTRIDVLSQRGATAGQHDRRHSILFLAANPSGTSKLSLDEECAAIERELRMTPGRDDFDFRSKWAVSVDELMRHLNESQPTIIHFSGHGDGHRRDLPARQQRTLRRDVDDGGSGNAGVQAGIYLQDERRAQYVSARALAQMIGSAAPSARIVVLNACYSVALADSLRDVVDAVIGMNGAIIDDAARSFAMAFYRSLGNHRSLGNAVAQAVATLDAKEQAESLPECKTRDGIVAEQLFLPSPPHY